MYEKNQLVQVKVTDLGSEGEGIGKIDGFPLFIKDALPGDEIEARIVKAKKNYAYARLERVLQPSPFRVEAVCKYAKQCGGCQIQSLAYAKQLEFKHSKVRNNLVRIGGVSETLLDEIMEPIVGMEPGDYDRVGCETKGDSWLPLYYRNKAQYPFGKSKDGQTICGFYAGRTHSIIANTDCYLGATQNKEVLEAVLEYMKECNVAPYDETTGKGLIRHVLIRITKDQSQLMVCIVVNGKSLPKKEKLTQKLTKIAGMHSISISPNEKNTNVILGDHYETIWGAERITDRISRVQEITAKVDWKTEFSAEGNVKIERWRTVPDSEIQFEISPLSFYQVNPVQMERLYSTALEYAELTGKETVWDLYCGIGTISLFLAKNAARVCGVEIVPQAIEDAWKNAELNHMSNVTFYVGKAEEVLPAFYEGKDMEAYQLAGYKGCTEEKMVHDTDKNSTSQLLHPDVICVDPPRKGCDEACLETMVKMQPDRIVYVSCDSATLARDVKYLNEHGYELKKVRCFDLFGNTVHVETVVLMTRTK